MNRLPPDASSGPPPHDPEVLERNLRALIGRAYQAKKPREEFRTGLKAQLLARVRDPFAFESDRGLVESARPAIGPAIDGAPRRLGRWMVPMLTAAAIAIAAVWWSSPSAVVPTTSLSAILAAQVAALRHAPEGAWVAADSDTRSFGTSEYLAVRTPDQASFDVSLEPTGLIRVGADSHVEVTHPRLDEGPSREHAEAAGRPTHVVVVSGHALLARAGAERTLRTGDRGLVSDLLGVSLAAQGDRTAVEVGDDDDDDDDDDEGGSVGPAAEATPHLVVHAFAARSSAIVPAFQVDAMPLWYDDEDHATWQDRTTRIAVDDGAAGSSLPAVMGDLRAGRYTVFVRARGFAPWRSDELRLGGAHPTVTLRAGLSSGQTLRGRVIDEVTSLPIAGATLFSETDSSSKWVPISLGAGTSDPRLRTIETDAEGYFEADGLGAGPQQLRAWKAGYAPTWKGVDRVAGGYVEISLGAGSAVMGRVEERGAPVSGATVLAIGQFSVEVPDIQPFALARTDAEGRYALTDLPAGVYVVMAFIDGRPADGAPALKVVNVDLSGPTSVDFGGSHAEVSQSGQLRDRDGAPLANMPLSFVAEGEALALDSRGWISAMTDDDGRFTVDLTPGRYEAFLVLGQGISVQRIGTCEAPAESMDLRIAGGEVVGVVRDEDRGTPLPGSVCVLLGEHDAFYGKVVADEAGVFSFRSVQNGPCRVIAHAVSEGFAEGVSAPLFVVGARLDVDVLVPRGGVLAVRVIDTAGAPIAGARVSIENAAAFGLDDGHGQTTGAGGRARFPTLPAKRLTVVARRGDDEQKVDVVIPAGGTTETTITFPIE